jgi:Rieske Fe-S protein
MTVDYEPAPKPAPLWLLPLVIALLALALLWAVQQFSDRDVGGFGGRAQPTTEMPESLADGSTPPEVPEELSRRFGDNVVMAKRLDDVPAKVERSCRRAFSNASDPGRRRLSELIQSSDVSAAHLGPDALTYLSIAVADAPPGYPREVEIACAARPKNNGWQAPPPLLDFALDGRPGVTLPSIAERETSADASEPSADATSAAASERPSVSLQRPSVRTRLVQIPLGAQWAVVPRGGWWLAHNVAETSWALLPLNDAVGDADPLRVVFIDATGDVVAERGVGPTRSAAEQDHSLDFELVAGAVPEVIDKLRKGPMRVCEPGNRTLCVWLALNELDEVLAYGAFGPHPLDTPPMGHIGYCPKAKQFQGSVTSGRYRMDGTWVGGPARRGLDRYTARFEAGMVVVDLNEHVTGEPATGEPRTNRANCRFTGTRARGKAN